MKEYLISLISLVSIVCVVIIVLPEGKMKRVSCISLSFLITFSLISPLKNVVLNKNEYNNNLDYSLQEEITYQENIYNYIVLNKLEKEKVNVLNVKTSLEEDNFLNIKKIGVKLDKSVINGQDEHISITVKVKEILLEIFNIKESQIYFYE